ncbi:cyclic AMP-responsive element-binding protein 5-like [Cynara cardunculus var. scolymus]|uniref:Phox/Bem1p n=1 Tax=Cynara cardunculus var. scolymus TaxID=59895 RepID=A0A118K0M7_CYNCS|nr:cyclic AMP-responsive element-binding protein 5-like [Cynara cardunculus var. scolymus]KVI01668.1 Phox/Bem1p [Cynara cardunculus var. scolymus]
MSTSGDAESTSSSVPNSAPGSPRCRVKFLCSHGGKILPRPADGHLKYVGGETRVISVPYNITFTDLMKKLSSLIEGDVILKYQLIPEDLDALVTVKSDEDLRLMFEEYDRHELIGTPRLRTFLFPANPIVLENQMGPMDHHSLEQRYINSVNGIVFHPTPTPSYRNFRPPAINTGQPIFSINSACSSPGTPPETTIPTTVPEVTNPEITVFRNKLSAMPRARSSPNLCNLGGNSQSNHMNPTPISTLNLSIGNQQHPHHYPHHNQNHRQPPPSPQSQPQPHHLHLHPHPHPHSSSPKPPLDPHPHKNSGQDHLLRQRSNDYYRHPTEHNQHAPPNHYGRPNRGTTGHMGYQRGSPYDQYYGNNRHDRTESPPGSPLARSPLQNNYISKWDSFGGRT